MKAVSSSAQARSRLLPWLGVLLLGSGIGSYWWFHGPSTSQGIARGFATGTSANQAAESIAPAESPLTAPAFDIRAPERHSSLRGSEVNGRISADSQGRLKKDRDVRRVFDYFLSLRGRVSDAAIREQLSQYLSANVTQDLAAETLQLFDRYLQLILAEVQIAEEHGGQQQQQQQPPAEVETILANRRALRREFLSSEVADAFYADQESYESFQLELMKIGLDKQLSPEEKREARIEAERLLTPAQRSERRKTFAFQDIKAAEGTGELGAEAEELVRQHFGEEALERLSIAEQEKAAWLEKRQAYLQEKARINGSDLSPDERGRLLKQYSDEHLTPAEQKRMHALDSLSDPAVH